jgi:hypothetical protein
MKKLLAELSFFIAVDLDIHLEVFLSFLANL